MRSSNCKRAAGLVAVATIAATLLLGGLAFAGGLGGFSVRPAHSDPADPATRAFFKPVVRRGGSFSDSVVVSNTGRTPLRLLTYPVDGLTGQTTGTVYANRRDAVRKAGRWVRLGTSRITVAPGQMASVPFTVGVPMRAKAGDHVAGIVFEQANPKTSGKGFRITEIIREVVGVQIRVPGKAAPQLALGGVKLSALPGTHLASVVVSIGNRGLALCKPTLAVSLLGPHGYRRGVVRQLDTVLPSDTVAYPLPWPGSLRNGKYLARTSTGCKGHHVTRRATVVLGKSLGSGPGTPTQRAGSSSLGGLSAWLLVAAALGGVGAGVALGRIRSIKAGRSMSVASGPSDSSQPSRLSQGPAQPHQ
jgi:hypothetical protein